jgi:hypothetical protein
MVADKHSTQSSYREMLLEHILVGEILRYLWLHNWDSVEVLKPQVDAAGYDIVFECNSVIRYVQFKASTATGRRANVNIQLKLGEKPGGCVIWYFFDPKTLKLGPFLWFGGAPGERLPPIEQFRVAKHSKGNATGMKAERQGLRLIPKGKFEKLESVDKLVERLFGVSVKAQQ